MLINTLAEINRGSKYWIVCVYVSHLWHHRGGTDNGPIKHTDMVLIDKQGNHMYGEVPKDLVTQFMGVIEEGKVYELARFMLYTKKTHFRPVEAEWMIKFGRYTSVQERLGIEPEFPFCTFSLTPITDLPNTTDLPFRFTDVVGFVTGVSHATQYHSANRSEPSTKRIIYLSDLFGHQISIVLWGERAIAFEGDWVLEIGKASPVIIIFVGTLVKSYEGRKGLSGSAACRWYINDDIPEITVIHRRLKDVLPQIETILLPNQTAAEISAQVDLETKTVADLLALDIWEHEHTKFFCTVTILRLSPAQRWWFFSCDTCHKSSVPYGTVYRCSDNNCTTTEASPRYLICYIGTDGHDEIELVFFDRVGREIIGKPLISILRSGHSNNTSLEDIVNSTRADTSIPRELAAVVSTKYKFVVQVTSKSFDSESNTPSYQVHRVDTNFGKQVLSPALPRKPILPIGSSTKPAPGQFPLLAGSSSGGHSPSQTTDTLDGSHPLSDSGDTNSGGLIPSDMTPPSIRKLPNPRSRLISATASARRTLRMEGGDQGQTGQVLGQTGQIIKDLPAGSVQETTLPTDGAVVKDPPPSAEIVTPTASSQVLDKLEAASSELRAISADTTTIQTLPVTKDVTDDAPAAAVPPELPTEKGLGPHL